MSFQSYYSRVIQNSQTGFKLVLGGTGLGKTTGIQDVILSSPIERKFIYCANRLQLLDEMQEVVMRKFGLASCARLPNDAEVVHFVVRSNLEESLIDLLRKKVRGEASQKALKAVERIRKIISKDLSSEYITSQDARAVLDAVRGLVLSTFQSSKAKHEELLNEPVVQALFPFIAFKCDPQKRLLLTTVQKGFRRFFDGEASTNLSSLRNTHYIIFLDEFDFLESDLTDIVCGAPQIEQPFDFVELFYREMVRHRLPKPDYPEQKRIKGILNRIKRLQMQGIPFPQINMFTRSTDLKNVPLIFQTTRTYINTSLYVTSTKPARSFEIVDTPEYHTKGTAKTHNALTLFHNVNQATYLILALFKSLKENNQPLYQEMKRAAYGGTDFHSLLERVTVVPRAHASAKITAFDALLHEGYGVYQIEDLKQRYDRDEVEFRHYSITETPERMLLDLAKNNLVFALSATADIPRSVRHFNLDWLKRQEGINYIEVSDEDRSLIVAQNEVKRKNRKTVLTVERIKPLSETNPLERQIKRYLDIRKSTRTFHRTDDKDEVKAIEFRLQRVERFFRVLLNIMELDETENKLPSAHLLFYLSFKDIEGTLEDNHADLFNAKKLDGGGRSFKCYEVEFAGHKFLVILYNAETARLLAANAGAFKFYQSLFWQGIPVICVTQYSSTGNGVNLQFAPQEGMAQTDFPFIYLMDAPHFFFADVQNSLEGVDVVKAMKINIWYAAKLFTEGLISRDRFKQVLSNIHTPSLNMDYKMDITSSNDALLSQIAILIQALGRIERVWTIVAQQSVIMGDEVFAVFARFVLEDDFSEIRESRAAIISNNLHDVLRQVKEIAVNENQDAQSKAVRSLAVMDSKSKRAIDDLLMRLRHFRNNQKDLAARDEWRMLRQAVLEHNFSEPIVQRSYAAWSKVFYENSIILHSDDWKVYPPRTKSHALKVWDLNTIYRLITQNDFIRDHFERRGLPLAFSDSEAFCFTPYIHQSILSGAIGEEAIEAILIEAGLETEYVPDPLFEIIDLKIAGRPWYIDCKNFTERTMDGFYLTIDSPGYRSKLNVAQFTKSAIRKLSALQKHHNEQKCKLIYMNLASDDDRAIQFFDARFNPCTNFGDAEIVVVQGILRRTEPNEFQTDFLTMIGEMVAN